MTKVPYYCNENEEWLPLIPKATDKDFGRVKLIDTLKETEDSPVLSAINSVAVSPKAIEESLNNYVTSETFNSLGDTVTTQGNQIVILEGDIKSASYKNEDGTIKKDLVKDYEDRDTALKNDLSTEIKNVSYKNEDGTIKADLSTKIESASYKNEDGTIKADLVKDYEGKDTDLKDSLTSGTVIVGNASKLNVSDITGATILNFKKGVPTEYKSSAIGSTKKPIYFDKDSGTFKACDYELHETNTATNSMGETQTLSGASSPSIVQKITFKDTGHVDSITTGEITLGAAGTNLGGVKTSKDLAFTNGEGAVVNLNLSSVKVDGGNTTLQDTLNSTYLKKSGDTFTGSLIGNKSNIIFTGDNNGLLWRLGGVDYDLLKTDTVSKGYIYTLGSTAFDTHIKGTSLYLQPSSGYLHINGAQGKNILQNADGITLGNDQSSLYLLSSDKGIHTNYPVQMHAVRYHLHEGLGSGGSHTNGVPITDKTQNRQGACLPLQLFSATSSFMGATDGNSKLFDRVYYWGDGSDSNSTGYDLAENALIAKYNASLLISGTIYANQLEAGSSIGGQIVYSTDGGETFSIVAGRMETRLPSAATTGHVIIPPVIVKVTKGSRIGLRCYTYTKSGYVPTHAADGTSVISRTHLDIVCLGLTA